MEIYKNIQYFNEIPSTNEYAISNIRDGNVAEFTVIVAHNQTKGKGQRGNNWLVKPKQNATFSIVLYPRHIKASLQFIISQCVALAVRNVLSEYVTTATVKWPNDVYVGQNKIAGILIENTLKGSNIDSSVIGVGLNCNQIDFDSSIPNPTSLQLETNTNYDVDLVLRKVLAEFYTLYTESIEKPDKIHQKYHTYMYNFLQEARYKDREGEFLGTIIKVDQMGYLYIEDSVHNIRKYQFKEVQFL